MATMLTDFSQHALVEAVEASLARYFSNFSRSPRAEVHETPELLRYLSGIPIPEYNGIVRARFPSTLPTHAILARIQREVAWFAERRQPFCWWVGAGDRPGDLSDHLVAAGLTPLGDSPGMAADLNALPEGEQTPSETVIVPVSDDAALRDWVTVASAGYGEPAEIMQARYAVHHDLGLGADAPLQRYVAYLDGEPVAGSALLLAAGVAGIYEVATAPHARRRGLGAAVTLAPLRRARALGYRIGVLQSSPMGVSVYARLGFQQVCTFSLYASEPVA